MKRFVLLLLISLASTSLYGQSSKTAVETFPTYKQIKPAHTEIIDFIAPNSKSEQVLKNTSQFSVNLSDYPEMTVTYILNGEPTTNIKYAKELINKKDTQIERVKINEPTQDGNLLIEIEYTIRQ